jgi:hypothetical protein
MEEGGESEPKQRPIEWWWSVNTSVRFRFQFPSIVECVSAICVFVFAVFTSRSQVPTYCFVCFV